MPDNKKIKRVSKKIFIGDIRAKLYNELIREFEETSSQTWSNDEIADFLQNRFEEESLKNENV